MYTNKRNRNITLLLALFSVGCASRATLAERYARETDLDSTMIPIELQEGVALSEVLGATLYELDRAAWVGTDVVMENAKDFATQNLGGYLAFTEGGDDGRPLNQWLVTFYTRDPSPMMRYQARVFSTNKKKPEFIDLNPPQPLLSGMAFMVNARQAAIDTVAPQMTQPPNTILLPGKKGLSEAVVYLFSATRSPNIAVIGRHYRVRVSLANAEVLQIEPRSEGDILLPYDDETKELRVKHTLTNYPTEAHVFASLSYRVPIIVTTSLGTWKVVGGKIFLQSNTLKP
jgi:hypothetical protein